MKKQTLLWTLYFVVCAVVITAAIQAGMQHNEFYNDIVLANK